MKNKLLYTLIIIPFLVIVFYKTSFSKKTHAPANQTGVNGGPTCGFSGTATNTCHGSPTMCGTIPSILGTLNKDVIIKANGTLVDADFKYELGIEYTMDFIVSNPTVSGGFSFAAVDSLDNHVGTLSVEEGAEAEISDTNSDYVGHTNSLGLNEWTFKWTAPATSTGKITFFATTLKGNGAIGGAFVNSCGDTIIPVKYEINESIEIIESLNDLSLLNDLSFNSNPIINNTIRLKLKVKEPKKYLVSVYDITGKLVVQNEHVYHIGNKYIEIPIEQKGIFILNITTNKNEFANFKILN